MNKPRGIVETNQAHASVGLRDRGRSRYSKVAIATKMTADMMRIAIADASILGDASAPVVA